MDDSRQQNNKNAETDDALARSAELVKLMEKPGCGNCKFAEAIPRKADDVINKKPQQYECHWGPPCATMIPQQVKPGVMAMHTYTAFPKVTAEFFCHRHERKMDG